MRISPSLAFIVAVMILTVLDATYENWTQETRTNAWRTESTSSRRADDDTQTPTHARGAWRETPLRESAATAEIDFMEWIDLGLSSSDYDPPVQLDAASIRLRILALIDQPPAFAPNDAMLFAIPRWCIAQFAEAESVTFEEATNIAVRALANSATHDGQAFLAAMERATPTTELDSNARRICATELYYALPDG
jgi:hypothetical protein